MKQDAQVQDLLKRAKFQRNLRKFVSLPLIITTFTLVFLPGLFIGDVGLMFLGLVLISINWASFIMNGKAADMLELYASQLDRTDQKKRIDELYGR